MRKQVEEAQRQEAVQALAAGRSYGQSSASQGGPSPIRVDFLPRTGISSPRRILPSDENQTARPHSSHQVAGVRFLDFLIRERVQSVHVPDHCCAVEDKSLLASPDPPAVALLSCPAGVGAQCPQRCGLPACLGQPAGAAGGCQNFRRCTKFVTWYGNEVYVPYGFRDVAAQVKFENDNYRVF